MSRVSEYLGLGLLLLILAFAVLAANFTRKASQVKPIRVREIVIVVDSAENAKALMEVMKDLMEVE